MVTAEAVLTLHRQAARRLRQEESWVPLLNLRNYLRKLLICSVIGTCHTQSAPVSAVFPWRGFLPCDVALLQAPLTPVASCANSARSARPGLPGKWVSASTGLGGHRLCSAPLWPAFEHLLC